MSSLDRGRIPLPGWFIDCLALWSFATALMALALVFRDSLAALVLLLLSSLPALVGAWIFLLNAIDLIKETREGLSARNELAVVHRLGDLRYIERVVAEGRRSIGTVHPNTSTVLQRVRENQSVLNVCLRELNDGRLSLYGYVLLYPLRDELGEAVLMGAVRSEAEFGTDPIRDSFLDARYVYVAMVWGADKHGRWHIKDRLREIMLELLSAGQVELVFARPGSAFGEAMMTEYGFTPIQERSGVWSIEGKRLQRRLATERALTKAVIVTEQANALRQSSTDSA